MTRRARDALGFCSSRLGRTVSAARRRVRPPGSSHEGLRPMGPSLAPVHPACKTPHASASTAGAQNTYSFADVDGRASYPPGCALSAQVDRVIVSGSNASSLEEVTWPARQARRQEEQAWARVVIFGELERSDSR